MTPSLLAKATGSTLADADIYCLHLDEAMVDFNIRSPKQRAAFIATITVESNHLADVEENLYYRDPQRIANIFDRVFHGDAAKAAPYARNAEKLGQFVYGSYRGRGLIQLTGLTNYKQCGDALGFDYIYSPKLLLEPRHAALSAGWYWETHDCNDPADEGDMITVTQRVNGDALMHLAEREAAYMVALTLGV